MNDNLVGDRLLSITVQPPAAAVVIRHLLFSSCTAHTKHYTKVIPARREVPSPARCVRGHANHVHLVRTLSHPSPTTPHPSNVPVPPSPAPPLFALGPSPILCLGAGAMEGGGKGTAGRRHRFLSALRGGETDVSSRTVRGGPPDQAGPDRTGLDRGWSYLRGTWSRRRSPPERAKLRGRPPPPSPTPYLIRRRWSGRPAAKRRSSCKLTGRNLMGWIRFRYSTVVCRDTGKYM